MASLPLLFPNDAQTIFDYLPYPADSAAKLLSA